MLVGRLADPLEAIVREVVAEHDRDVLGIEVMADHVRLLVDVPPGVRLSRLFQLVEVLPFGAAAPGVPRLRRLPTLCPPSWLVSTVGAAPPDVIRLDIENQTRAA